MARMAPASGAAASSAGVLEADAAHSHDPQYFTDYVNEIHDHYRSVEVSPARSCLVVLAHSGGTSMAVWRLRASEKQP